jgi:hypothetical protein
MKKRDKIKASLKNLDGKRAVVRLLEADKIVFESEGKTVTVPIADLPQDMKDMIEKYRKWPGVLPGVEIEVKPVRCQYHWHMENCWAAYTWK